MENKYYIGDIVMTKTLGTMGSMSYIFNGAKKTETGWVVSFSQWVSGGYAGGLCPVEYEVSEYEVIQLGANARGYPKNAAKPAKLGMGKKISSIQFQKIEKYNIEVSFEYV